MKKIMSLIMLLAVVAIAQSGTDLTLKSVYFYKTNDFVYQSPKDTVNTYQTTQYKVLDSYKANTNIIIHVIRLNSNNQYNIIMSDNTIEIVCTSCDDGTRVVFVLKETKNNFF